MLDRVCCESPTPHHLFLSPHLIVFVSISVCDGVCLTEAPPHALSLSLLALPPPTVRDS